MVCGEVGLHTSTAYAASKRLGVEPVASKLLTRWGHTASAREGRGTIDQGDLRGPSTRHADWTMGAQHR